MGENTLSKLAIPPQKVVKQSRRWWIALGALLATSVIPCPECGGPLVLHIWPLAALLLVIRAVARRARLSHNNKEIVTDNLSDADTSPR